MPEARWTSMKLVAVGPSGRSARLDGRVLDVDDSPGLFTPVSVAIAIGLVAIGLFVPPVLLLGIPVLLVRAAVWFVRTESRERVALGGFDCPECGGANDPAERRGTLPLDLPCPRCGARLSIGQVPRTYR